MTGTGSPSQAVTPYKRPGSLERPSEDADLFTAWNRQGDFEDAVVAVTRAYNADGLDVEIDPGKRFAGSFARLFVSDPASREEAKVEMGVDWRANEPVRMAIGPVLHPDDAVANKMCALWGRFLARDFIDVDAAFCSSRYSRGDLLALAANADRGFDGRSFTESIARLGSISSDDFAEYGMYGRELDELRGRFAQWRGELLAASPGC